MISSATHLESSVNDRLIPVATALSIGLLLLIVFYFLLPDGAAKLLIDRGGYGYPLSVQNLMWLVFFAGLGELWVRYHAGNLELQQIGFAYLPEGSTVILQSGDLGPIYSNVVSTPFANLCFLPRLIQRTILQFQSTQSIEQASTVLNASLDLYLHEIDLRYNLLRYIMWLIPTLGFIGTVIGIALALNYAGAPGGFNDPNLLPEVTQRLAVAFNTTLIALVLAAILVFSSSVIQAQEEKALNLAGNYCLDNLINRLYVAP